MRVKCSFAFCLLFCCQRKVQVATAAAYATTGYKRGRRSMLPLRSIILRSKPFQGTNVLYKGAAAGFTSFSAAKSSGIGDADHVPISTSTSPPRHIAIVGGGLAGLSTAWFLLKKSIEHNSKVEQQQRQQHIRITIIDKALPGRGGASSVAGGYVVHSLH